MIVRRTASRFTAALCLSAVLPLALAACSATPNAKIEEAGGDAAANMGSAEPAQSPASNNPAGRVVQFEAVRDLDTTNGVVGVRTENALLIGSIDDLSLIHI